MLFPNHPSLTPLISHHSADASTLGPYWSQPGRSIVEGLLDQIPFPLTPSPYPDTSTLPDLDADDPSPSSERIDEPLLPPLGGDESFDFSSWDPHTAIRLKRHPDGSPWLMRKMFTLPTLDGYLRTWSSLHTYHESHPEDAARTDQGPVEGDIVDRLVGRIAVGMGGEGPRGGEQKGEIEGAWSLTLMMIKKKA